MRTWFLPLPLSVLIALGLASACSQTDMSSGGRDAKQEDTRGKPAKGKKNGADGADGSEGEEDGEDDDAGGGGEGQDAGGGDADGGWDSGFLDGGSEDQGLDGAGAGTDQSKGAGGLIVDEGNAASQKVPQFGLLVNDLRCGLCHVKVNGDVVSTSEVPGVWPSSVAEVNGSWTAAQAFKAKTPGAVISGALRWGSNVRIDVSGGVNENSPTSVLMPKDRTNDGLPDFPTLDVGSLAGKMTGRLKGKNDKGGAVDVRKVHEGNLVVVGTDAAPFRIVGEVLVKGDLVIKGTYQGIGNIYVTGNVYIPGDLRGKKSPFPYPTDPAQALAKGKASLAAKDDALAIATPKSIIVSDFDTHGPGNKSVFEHELTPAEDRADALGVKDVYNWFGGGKAGFGALFDTFEVGCRNPAENRGDNDRSFSRVDAFLYAAKAIGGRANRNSYSINGGIIADHFHIISAARDCPAGNHPVHQQDQRWSYVNYDWRMKAGLLLLKQLGHNFK